MLGPFLNERTRQQIFCLYSFAHLDLVTEARQAERSAAPAYRFRLLQPQTPKHLQALSPCLLIYQKLYFDRKIPLSFKKLLGAPCKAKQEQAIQLRHVCEVQLS